MKKGILYAIGAYVSWGLLPVYWKWLHQVPALQLLCHRIVWSFLTLLVVLFIARRWKLLERTTITSRIIRFYFIAAILIGINWFMYVWAVNSGHIIETSLGYFINPLLSVFMGVLVMHEHLRLRQWVPIGIAALGVIYLTFIYGHLPWIALILAVSFGLYGLVKKISPLGSFIGLTLETGILFLPAVLFLSFSEYSREGIFLHSGLITNILLVGAGIVTTAPLFMFASAAKRIPLSLVGILQYISPTLQFLLGVFIYQESFTREHLIGYSIVWLALLLFGVESFYTYRTQYAVMEPD